MPDHRAGGAGDDDYGRDAAQGCKDVAVLQRIDGVYKRPVFAGIVGLGGKQSGVEMVDCFPGPEEVASCIDVLDAIAVSFPIWCFALRDSARNRCSLLWRESLESGIENLAISKVVLVVVSPGVAMF